MTRHSVVIPTRDRPHLLPGAIRSAVAQTVGDLEIVVSDNGKADGTAGAIAAWTGSRAVRHVRTGGDLLMHDSWQFALEQARGEWVTFLCDDDALHPRALEVAGAFADRHGADVVAWRSCSWMADDWPTVGAEGRFRFPTPYSDRAHVVRGDRMLDLALDLRVTFTDTVPKMLNTAVRRDVLERIRRDGARLFHPASPDYSAALVLAAYARSILLLDTPLLVAGATPDSIGAAAVANQGEAAARFIEELTRREPDLVLPEPPLTPSVWLAQTWTHTIRHTSALAGRSVNMVNAYARAATEIERWRAAGQPVEPDLAELRKRMTPALRAMMASGGPPETEGHLEPTDDPTPVLGRGPFAAPGGRAAAAGFPTIDTFASGIDAWIERSSVGLDDLWDRMADAAGPRRSVVVYGLGMNGRAIIRTRPRGDHPLHGRVVVFDDGAVDPPEGLRLLAGTDELDPDRHFILVTPASSDGIATVLAERGFVRDRDWTSVMSGEPALSSRCSAFASGTRRGPS